MNQPTDTPGQCTPAQAWQSANLPDGYPPLVRGEARAGLPRSSGGNGRYRFERLSSARRQTGSVLAISLVMLLLLTLVGVTAMQTTGLEERMAGNMRDRNLAFQAAESALRVGEGVLGAQNPLPDFIGTNGLYESNAAPPGIDGSWVNGTVEYSDASDQVAENPRYIIQRLGNVGGSLEAGTSTDNQSEMYRVTARGVGGTTTAVVVVQSTYKR